MIKIYYNTFSGDAITARVVGFNCTEDANESSNLATQELPASS